MTCKARQVSDQMYCKRCGLTWDCNDPEPPRCPYTSWDDFIKHLNQLLEQTNDRP